ncbi:MAG: DUF4836 family protein [Crocinitomicaceae bacterium]|nr:DUF4836 family protein [Crocinitomicaceae bacterium]
MRFSILALTLFVSISAFAQKSENLIPKDATSVFSINNISLLQKISLDDLVKYEFMEEVQAELFDGSTTGKTLKDSGIDFNQKMNIFFGQNEDFEVAGLSFGITNKDDLFDVFDDFSSAYSNYQNVAFFESYFSRIAIENNSGVLFRVTPNTSTVDELTDSIWYARGNDYPWYDNSFEDIMESTEQHTSTTDEPEVEFFDDMETEENTITPTENSELPIADENPNTKTYYELRDSVETALSIQFLSEVCDELFIDNKNLVNSSKAFADQLTHTSEGIFFMDNSKGLKNNRDFKFLSTIYPTLYTNIEQLYTGNILLGDLVLNDNSVEMQINAQYGEELGSIYEKLSDAKFDKNVLKYIHKDNSAYFTYRVNLREAYEQAYDVIIPMLSEEENPSISTQLLIIELMDEFINKDAVFDTYKGSMFGTFNGIQKVKTKKVVFDYDEETFNYTEREEEAEEDMPIFTLGFSTDRTDIPSRILERVARLTDECRNEGEYWVIDRAILNSAPLYLILKNDLFILTNDEHLAKNNSDGFGDQSIGKKEGKIAQKSGIVYGYADLGLAIESLPRELFNNRENEMIDVVRGKSGKISFTSTESTKEGTSFNLVYDFESEGDSETYILDLINSMYVISK